MTRTAFRRSSIAKSKNLNTRVIQTFKKSRQKIAKKYLSIFHVWAIQTFKKSRNSNSDYELELKTSEEILNIGVFELLRNLN